MARLINTHTISSAAAFTRFAVPANPTASAWTSMNRRDAGAGTADGNIDALVERYAC